MFNVGGPEILVILLVALVILGPDQLPKAMRTFGNVMAEIRKVSGGFQDEMRKAMDTIDTKGTSAADKAKPSVPKPSVPKSPKSSSGQAAVTASTPAEADVTEVVARNNGAPTAGSEGSFEQGAEPVDPVEDRPKVDPADRAAG